MDKTSIKNAIKFDKFDKLSIVVASKGIVKTDTIRSYRKYRKLSKFLYAHFAASTRNGAEGLANRPSPSAYANAVV